MSEAARHKAQAKARAILDGYRAEGYTNEMTANALAQAVAWITSADRTMRETAKRRLRDVAAKANTGA